MKTANTFKEFAHLQIGDEFTSDLAEGKKLVVVEDDECLCKGCVFDKERGEKLVCLKVACSHDETQNGGYSVVFKELENGNI